MQLIIRVGVSLENITVKQLATYHTTLKDIPAIYKVAVISQDGSQRPKQNHRHQRSMVDPLVHKQKTESSSK